MVERKRIKRRRKKNRNWKIKRRFDEWTYLSIRTINKLVSILIRWRNSMDSIRFIGLKWHIYQKSLRIEKI